MGTNAGLGKKTISQDGDDGSSGRSILLKRSENAGSAPPPPSFSLFRPYNMDSLGTKIRLVELFKSQLLNPSRPLPPPPPATSLPLGDLVFLSKFNAFGLSKTEHIS